MGAKTHLLAPRYGDEMAPDGDLEAMQAIHRRLIPVRTVPSIVQWTRIPPLTFSHGHQYWTGRTVILGGSRRSRWTDVECHAHLRELEPSSKSARAVMHYSTVLPIPLSSHVVRYVTAPLVCGVGTPPAPATLRGL